MKIIAITAAMLLMLLTACADDESSIFTLYRNSVLDATMRLHVATFDAQDGRAYNSGNCDQARILFQQQPGVKTHFWCEPGRFDGNAVERTPLW